MVDPAIIDSVKNYLNALTKAGISVSFGVIFGSYASGQATPLSDIDLLVVSSEFTETIPREIVKKLWHIAARTDSRIEPIACSEAQWENDVSSAIIEIARTQGQTVKAA
jgi:predicted nucleotidyltransferase